MKDIVFTDTLGVAEAYSPRPAAKALPEWYKNMDSITGSVKEVVDGRTPHTIKKCVPVFDALTAGYIIPTYVDVQVTNRDDLPYYEWPTLDAISFHPIEQASLHPQGNGAPIPKWRNPWSIRTPKGYSCLVISPLHNPNGIFTIMAGIVDTDSYTAPINLPFTLDDVTWTGIIPAGAPMAQIIPFRRESWKMLYGGDMERMRQSNVTNMLKALWFNSYKRQFWSRKEYR